MPIPIDDEARKKAIEAHLAAHGNTTQPEYIPEGESRSPAWKRRRLKVLNDVARMHNGTETRRRFKIKSYPVSRG